MKRQMAEMTNFSHPETYRYLPGDFIIFIDKTPYILLDFHIPHFQALKILRRSQLYTCLPITKLNFLETPCILNSD